MTFTAHESVGSRRGFTLLELMVVLVLIAILTALILPEMKGSRDDAALRSAARRFAAAFAIANSRAITVNRLHEVHIDATKGRYLVAPKRAGQAVQDEKLTDFAGNKGEFDSKIKVQLVPRIEPENDVPTTADKVSFYPDGTADATDVLLRDRTGFGLVLRINPVTARVQVMELERQ